MSWGPRAVRSWGFIFVFVISFRRINPNGLGQPSGLGNSVDEAFGILHPGLIERFHSGVEDLAGLTVM